MSAPNIAVLGDCFLDVDVVGTAERLAPDTPVPVLDVQSELNRPGGAGLAAMLLAQAGARTTLIAPLSTDENAALIGGSCQRAGVRLYRLPTTAPTASKQRVTASHHAMLRIDRNTQSLPAPEVLDERTMADVLAILGEADAVLVSDYGRGVTSNPQLRKALAALAGSKPIVWDPHLRGAEPVPGVRLVTPNATELIALSGMESSVGASQDLRLLTQAGAGLLAKWMASSLCVTLGARGALLIDNQSVPQMVPATEVAGDACGAGDQFAATAVVELAAARLPSEAVHRAVAAAGEFIADKRHSALFTGQAESMGVRAAASYGQPPGSALDLARRVRERGGKVVATGGCFDLLHAGHLSVLQAARNMGDCLIVVINSDESIRRLKGPHRPLIALDERKSLLLELSCVDAVCEFHEDTPQEVLRELRPDFWVKGGDYSWQSMPEVLTVGEWGGQVVTTPYMPGHSTTQMLNNALMGMKADSDADEVELRR